MKKEHWDSCRSYEERRCRQLETIDRIMLIPQLLDPAELEAAKRTCDECREYLSEKRVHSRIKRLFTAVISIDQDTTVNGKVVNVSAGGALIETDSQTFVEAGDRIIVGIFVHASAFDPSAPPDVQLDCLVKRIDRQKNYLAVSFVSEIEI
ncbi:MAG: PilZ domain-containing protein [Deltaproteobacteria bacterium]|nr:PilZ domain-containing protein [Deltaproteobacteria bacterium]MBW2072002.1 PilZ domain-containing protein [Deltaproteobacteria bacterium]